MFRKPLLATTALVVCLATAHADREIGRPSDRIVPRFMKQSVPGMLVHGFPVTVMPGRRGAAPVRNNVPLNERGVTFSNLSKDKNAEFVSWYGFTAVYSTTGEYVSHSYHYKFSEIGFNAAPFMGAGKKVTKIGAPFFTYSSDYEVNLGIYSATASGLPGNEIAGGSTTGSDTVLCCTGFRWVNVDIFLKAGKEYLFAVRCGSAPCDAGWNVEDTNLSGSAVDYWIVKEYETYNFDYGKTYTYSYTSPWHSTSGFPANGAFVIK
jgi:hypothetical protein